MEILKNAGNTTILLVLLQLSLRLLVLVVVVVDVLLRISTITDANDQM